MTKQEFATEIAWVICAIRCDLVQGDDEDAELERKAAMTTYYECLGDLPADVFHLAAMRVALSHPWKTFPSVAEFREAAALTIGGEVGVITGFEAFGIAYRRAASFDPDLSGPYFTNGKLFNSHAEAMLDGLDRLAIETIRRFGGLTALSNADPNFARREFAVIYDGLVAREHQHRLLPAAVKSAIAAIGQREAPPPAIAHVIGHPEEMGSIHKEGK